MLRLETSHRRRLSGIPSLEVPGIWESCTQYTVHDRFEILAKVELQLPRHPSTDPPPPGQQIAHIPTIRCGSTVISSGARLTAETGSISLLFSNLIERPSQYIIVKRTHYGTVPQGRGVKGLGMLGNPAQYRLSQATMGDAQSHLQRKQACWRSWNLPHSKPPRTGITSLLTEDLRSMPGADVSLAWAVYWVPEAQCNVGGSDDRKTTARSHMHVGSGTRRRWPLRCEMVTSAVTSSAFIKRSRTEQQQSVGVGDMGETCACCVPMHSPFRITNRHLLSRLPSSQAPNFLDFSCRVVCLGGHCEDENCICVSFD
ncbi:hypothetical protein B0I37DRAFT_379228 [Chaetomium sp. MPI-CAGE-AT-0009]|nr:hypothetical protein B0I37DRAFT_379228 [Chaetomium sp. MPI-CAGE-AT-0009]